MHVTTFSQVQIPSSATLTMVPDEDSESIQLTSSSECGGTSEDCSSKDDDTDEDMDVSLESTELETEPTLSPETTKVSTSTHLLGIVNYMA